MPEESLPRRILACVESIPPGKVMTYGDVAEFCGSRAARMVGRVLAMDGRGEFATRDGEHGTVPWHRVLRANGTCAEHLYTEQRQLLLSEGVRFIGNRVDLAAHRWDGRAVSSRSAAPASSTRRRPGTPRSRPSSERAGSDR
ncbi:MAG: MGMT family protein [Jatrophihabitantaceae bacterium]